MLVSKRITSWIKHDLRPSFLELLEKNSVDELFCKLQDKLFSISTAEIELDCTFVCCSALVVDRKQFRLSYPQANQGSRLFSDVMWEERNYLHWNQNNFIRELNLSLLFLQDVSTSLFFNCVNSKQRNIINTIYAHNTSKISTLYKYSLNSSHRNIFEKKMYYWKTFSFG